ncbi:MAG: cytochrome P450 [Pseudonocardia sp.]|uniref:cytochrome P450 n=1 Tax=unclassified Pseudonocardia TaxID=2619320 RepID=UPI00086A32E1|nr:MULTISPECIES: cytochrome P450 [unclassified Pseudonocardia]MBN9110328.1 cytochrome P450 [Pseudonocardia sp.]ODU24335.1 MAG: cytochrome [Pseudonocardia sp. SCN 72-51]ODV06444.1 MAG: cytochrome [Pseudonocardia sp. SCN 73-27]
MAASGGPRRFIRWALRHGLVRRAVGKRAAAGELGARLMLDPTVLDEPYPFYEQVRARGRFVDTGLALTTVDHAVALEILRSKDFGVGMRMPENLPGPIRLALRAGGTWSLGPAQPPSMLSADPPDHTRYRKLVTRAFSAKQVAALRHRTEEIATGLLDDLAARPGGNADLVADYAALLPATVIAEMLGAPLEMRDQFLRWGEGGALSLDMGLTFAEFRRTERDIDALHAWMLGHFDRIRANPGDDILSALVGVHDEEGGLSQDELSSIAMLLLAAGFETTVNLIGSGAALLLRHPDQLALLHEDPSRWTNAIDEMLRIDSPVQRTGRVADVDVEVAGTRLPAGSVVILQLGGANRDPAVFDEPTRFDVLRANAADHIAFSSGIHYCLGAGLAKMEGEVALRALFERFPDLTAAGPGRRRPTRTLRGYASLPVSLARTTVPA